MKTFTCNELGGACDAKISGETMDEVGMKAREHGMEMVKKGDESHMKAMEKMKKMGEVPGAHEEWMKKTAEQWAVKAED